jgi:(R,R)-butanediol dehydrogenase/meso-butanediol dehydrogenase/diacetyl reductase
MKALRWYGKKDLRYEDAPEPHPGPGQVKARIQYVGVCGSDLMEYADGPCMIPLEKTPIIIGHEFMGRVVELGQGVTGFQPGDRVTGLGAWACGECYFCRRGRYNLCEKSVFTGMNVNGCMAEYLVAPDYTYYKVPDSVPDRYAALVEPLSVGMHALHVGKISVGNTVAVVGDGAIGLGVIMLARAAGASEIYAVAKHPSRGEVAAVVGATRVIYIKDSDPVQGIRELTGGLGVDISFECVGRQDTVQMAVDLARSGGTTVTIGVFHGPVPFDFNKLGLHEKAVIGSPIYIDEARAVLSLLDDGRIDPARLITAVVPFKDALEKGFERQLADKSANIKVLLELP